MDIVANALNCMMNAKKAGKNSCSVPASKLLLQVLSLLKEEGYVNSFTKQDANVIIEFGTFNKCGAIKPRFYVKKNGYEKFVTRYLPARDLGIIIVSTNKGVVNHKKAIEEGLGGSLIAYAY